MRARSEIREVSLDANDLVAAARIVSGKWKIKIVCLLFEGTKRFGEIRRLQWVMDLIRWPESRPTSNEPQLKVVDESDT